jgi:hypothetical protein
MQESIIWAWLVPARATALLAAAAMVGCGPLPRGSVRGGGAGEPAADQHEPRHRLGAAQHRPHDSGGVLAAIGFGFPLMLGLEAKDSVMLALTFLVSAVTLRRVRTCPMQGAVRCIS